MIAAGYERMNLEGDSLVLFGPAAALPHGTQTIASSAKATAFSSMAQLPSKATNPM